MQKNIITRRISIFRDDFIDDLTTPVDFVSGPEVAAKVRKTLMALRGG